MKDGYLGDSTMMNFKNDNRCRIRSRQYVIEPFRTVRSLDRLVSQSTPNSWKSFKCHYVACNKFFTSVPFSRYTSIKLKIRFKSENGQTSSFSGPFSCTVFVKAALVDRIFCTVKFISYIRKIVWTQISESDNWDVESTQGCGGYCNIHVCNCSIDNTLNYASRRMIISRSKGSKGFYLYFLLWKGK